LVKEAQALGAAEYVSTSGERLLAVTPALFSTVVEGAAEKLHLDVLALQQIAAGAGLLVSPADEKAATRARKAAERLVRDARFRKDVLAAYSDRCALCGLGLGTVVGAHVYPAAAPASTDAVTNGIALCANHHIIYDKHMLAFERQGDELLLRINPALASNLDPRDRVLIEALPREVRQPAKISKRITDQNLEARRAYFDPAYDWV
jgi:putative restriction endonuclease